MPGGNCPPFIVRLDRRYCLTGTYSAGTGRTSWTLPLTDATMTTATCAIVLGGAFGASSGTVVTPFSVSGTTVQATGNYSAGVVTIGRLYTMSVELSTVFRRSPSGSAILNEILVLRQIVAAHRNTWAYKLRASMSLRTDRTKSFAPTSVEAFGTLRAFFNGLARLTRLFIENDTAKPSTVSSVEITVDASARGG